MKSLINWLSKTEVILFQSAIKETNVLLKPKLNGKRYALQSQGNILVKNQWNL